MGDEDLFMAKVMDHYDDLNGNDFDNINDVARNKLTWVKWIQLI